mmetsp:Transcript_19285/g.54132  ORF Transcript_19285/g.54132 Transcript_19285/m.54132 type:complete len:385 (-) Transcript_19285:1368-2522(-)
MEGKEVVVVVGGGVVGMSTAVGILAGMEKGERRTTDVIVVSASHPTAATSRLAGALWEYPPYNAYPQELAESWALRTGEMLRRATQTHSRIVQHRRFVVVYRKAMRTSLDNMARYNKGWVHVGGAEAATRAAKGRGLEPDRIPGDAPVRGYFEYDAVTVDMPNYMRFLTDELYRRGGRLVLGEVRSLTEACQLAGVAGARLRAVINCTGRNGDALHPRGPDPAAQRLTLASVLLVHCPQLKYAFADDDHIATGGPIYAIPRGVRGEVVVGGTATPLSALPPPGQNLAHVSPHVHDEILERAQRYIPALKGARILGRYTGVRPGRTEMVVDTSTVTLEDGKPVPALHMYGHGGSGVATSLGCVAFGLDRIGLPFGNIFDGPPARL